MTIKTPPAKVIWLPEDSSERLRLLQSGDRSESNSSSARRLPT